MENWIDFAFGPEETRDPRVILRALDHCLGADVETAIRLMPDMRPAQLRRLVLFLAGFSDKEVSALTGEGESAVRVARFRFRRRFAAAGADGRRLAARISRQRRWKIR